MGTDKKVKKQGRLLAVANILHNRYLMPNLVMVIV